MTTPEPKARSVSERLRELVGWTEGRNFRSRAELRQEFLSIAEAVEEQAQMLRDDGDPTCVLFVADALAPEAK